MITLKTFRIVAVAEATSFLALLVGSVLKRTADADILVTVLGPIHGALFVAYLFLVLYLRPDEGWSTRTTALIVLGAVLPFGGYVVERRVTSSSRSPEVRSAGS